MEGIIPLVFRALKKNKIRRQYECLSTEAAQSYDISDFYVNGENSVYITQYSTEHDHKVHEDRYGGHRRHKSVGDFCVGYSTPAADDRSINYGGTSVSPPQMPKQLVRFRSHRMFSCVTGA